MIMYIKYISNENAFLIDIINIPIMILIIFMIPVERMMKIVLIILIIVVFRINLCIYWYLINVSFKVSNNMYIGTNERLRKDITELFKDKFNFIHNFEKLPTYPTMIVSNYIYDRLEHIACIVIPREIAIVMGKAMIDLAKLDKVVNNLILRPTEGGSFEKVKVQVKEKYKKGLSIFTYVTKISHSNKYINRVRCGMFTIAKDLGIPVTPVAIDYINFNTFGVIVPQNFRISVGETFIVNNVNNARYQTRIFLREQHKLFIKNKFTKEKIQ